MNRGHRFTLVAIALSAFVLFELLGMAVRGGEPAWCVSIESALLNHSTLVAWWITWACYVYVLVPVAALLIVLAWRLPAWRGPICMSLLALLLCWQGADLAQHLFARPRRLDWVVRHEMAFSYPSSHAAISAGFYGMWAFLLAAYSTTRAGRAAGWLLGIFALAICWSRLALGAHYLTDVAGGILLGTAIACAAGAAAGPLARPKPLRSLADGAGRP